MPCLNEVPIIPSNLQVTQIIPETKYREATGKITPNSKVTQYRPTAVSKKKTNATRLIIPIIMVLK
jgi:hypothetical protein